MPTIEEVRTRVDEQLSSIVSVAAEYRLRQSPHPESSIGVDVPDIEQKWTWRIDGPKIYVRLEPMKFPGSDRWAQTYWTFDGQRAYQPTFDSQPDQMTGLSILPNREKLTYSGFPDCWLGVRLARTDETLVSLLSRPASRVGEWERVDGQECLRLDLECQSRGGSPVTLAWQVWLDPAHDWMPRQFLSRNIPATGDGDSRVFEYRQVVTEFRRVPDGILKRDRWFPVKFHGVGWGARNDYELLEISVNEPIQPELFVIEPQIGTTVSEHVPSDPKNPFRIRVHGGPQTLAALQQETVQQAEAMTVAGGGTDATPRTGNPAIYGWLIAGFLAIGALLVRWRRAASLVLLTLSLGALTEARAQASAPTIERALPSIEEVRSKVEATLASLVSASVTYRTIQSPDPDPEAPWKLEAAGIKVRRVEQSWTWRMDREKRAAENEPWKMEDGRWARIHRAYDGRRMYVASYDSENSSRMEQLNIRPHVDPSIYEFHPDAWLGLHLVWTDQTLLSLLARPDVRIVGWEDLGGNDCLHLDLGEGATRGGETVFWHVWLDPQRDWLPRQLVSRLGREGSDGGRPDFVHRQVVTQFRRIPDRLLGRERWFPERFLSRLAVRLDYEVLDVSVNEPISADLFAIEPQIGTKVTEATRDPNRPVRSWIHGGPEALASIRREMVAQAERMAGDPKSPLVNAAPHSAPRLELYGSCIAAIFGLTAAAIWWRRR